MTIGELAKRSGVSQSTIRFYERLGIVRPQGRTVGNYRYFDASAIDRIRFIRSAQASGLSLEEVGTLLAFQEGTEPPCAEVQALVEGRLEKVNEQIKHLRHAQRVLMKYRDACEKSRGESCPVLDQLGGQRKAN